MKVLVVGNCQARPLGTLLECFAGVELIRPIILQLARDTERQAHDRQVAEADLILSQLTAPVFQPQHLRSEALKHLHPDKTVVWPNLFFAGQQPYLRYVTHATMGRVLGPLESTHDLRLLQAWFRERSGVAFKQDMAAEGYEARVADRSLNELKQREQSCDVAVTDLIETEMTARKLFFTFNHPSIWLLARLAERILAHLGQRCSIDDSPLKEPLGKFRPPASLPFSDPPAPVQGVAVNLDTPGKIGLGPVRAYTPAELRQSAFACYDHLQAQLQPEALRITPSY